MADAVPLVIIGGGPGGYAAAFHAADLGLDVTLISDEPRLGGVCLKRGCIPSKALLHAAGRITGAQDDARMGLTFGEPDIDLDRLRSWKDDVVDRLVGGLGQLAEGRGVHVVQGRARFTGPHALRIENRQDDADTEELTFQHAIIATGSEPVPLPDAPFGDRVWDSARALELSGVPERLLIVGGGYVGLEMGTVYDALGARVTVVEMADRLLPLADADLVKPLATHLRDRLEAIHTGTTVTGLEPDDDGVHATFDGEDAPDDATFDRVLVAVGRRPRSDDLGLDDIGVERDEHGFIVVDEQRATSVDGLYAIGDVAGGRLLAHKAMHEGRVAVEVIAGEPAAFDNRAVPAVVYTEPQVAWCGCTERAAQEEGRDVDVARFPWSASGRAVTLGANDGLTKIVVDPETQAVLGVGVVGPDAETLIAEGVLAVEMGAVARDLADTIHAHPTLAETLGEAAERFLGSPTHVAPSRGRQGA